MKKYEKAEVRIVWVETQDVIRASPMNDLQQSGGGNGDSDDVFTGSN